MEKWEHDQNLNRFPVAEQYNLKQKKRRIMLKTMTFSSMHCTELLQIKHILLHCV